MKFHFPKDSKNIFCYVPPKFEKKAKFGGIFKETIYLCKKGKSMDRIIGRDAELMFQKNFHSYLMQLCCFYQLMRTKHISSSSQSFRSFPNSESIVIISS